MRQTEGTVKNDRGQIDSVKLQLIYCRITAPISGRVGLRLVDPGNIVHTTDTTGIVVITQLQPITVVFTIPEDNIPSVLDQLTQDVEEKNQSYQQLQNNIKKLESEKATIEFRLNTEKSNLAVEEAQFQDAITAKDEAASRWVRGIPA